MTLLWRFNLKWYTVDAHGLVRANSSECAVCFMMNIITDRNNAALSMNYAIIAEMVVKWRQKLSMVNTIYLAVMINTTVDPSLIYVALHGKKGFVGFKSAYNLPMPTKHTKYIKKSTGACIGEWRAL